MTDIDKERAAFEAWIGLNDRIGPHAERHGDTYTDNYVGEMWEAWLARASTPPSAAEPCAHRIADARNKVVKSGYMCIDCGAVFAAADHDGPRSSAAPAVQAVGELDAVMADANLSNIACMMGNAMYNMSQQEGKTLTAADCELFDNLRKQWDAVRDAVPAIQPPPSAEPAPGEDRPVVGIVDERYLRPTIGGEG